MSAQTNAALTYYDYQKLSGDVPYIWQYLYHNVYGRRQRPKEQEQNTITTRTTTSEQIWVSHNSPVNFDRGANDLGECCHFNGQHCGTATICSQFVAQGEVFPGSIWLWVKIWYPSCSQSMNKLVTVCWHVQPLPFLDGWLWSNASHRHSRKAPSGSVHGWGVLRTPESGWLITKMITQTRWFPYDLKKPP